MATVFPSIYRAKATRWADSKLIVLIPQVFGEAPVTVTDFTGTPTTGMGWVLFQGGNPEFPVWLGRTSGGAGTGTGADEVWIGPDEPEDEDIELWYDTNEELMSVPLMTIKGILYGTSTPLPVGPTVNDLWTIGSPVPTVTPVRADIGVASVADVILYNGTAWLNIGPIGAPGPPGVPQRQTVVAKAGTTYTLALADEDKLLYFNSSSAITLTVPPIATVPLPVGARVDIAQIGNGKITVVAPGLILIATPSAVLRMLGSAASLVKLASDTWLLSGDLT